MKPDNSVSIVDLDGTLINGNSFTMFCRFCLKSFPGLSPAISAVALVRKLRIISHGKAKQLILKIVSGHMTHDHIQRFVNELNGILRHDVLESIVDSKVKILATAAPSIYAVPYAEMLGFDLVSATETGGPENCESEKLASLYDMGVIFSENSMVYTDHSDDIPLLHANSEGSNILVYPSEESLQKIKGAIPKIKFSLFTPVTPA